MISVRQAESADAGRIMELIRSLAEHHNQLEYVSTSLPEILSSGFGHSPRFGVLLAEYNHTVVGFLSFTLNYSIWGGCDYLNIDDVYVDENYRGKRIGESLMIEARRHCQNKGISKLKWEVEKGNASAIRFYERLGANKTDKGIFSWEVKT